MKQTAQKKTKILVAVKKGPQRPVRTRVRPTSNVPSRLERNKYYDALVALRNQIVNMLRNISASTLTSSKQAGEELADVGSDNFTREVGLAMMTEDGKKLAAIQEAIDRLAAGTYGTCSECGKRISEARLNALPYADLCVDCQTLHEEQQKMSQTSPADFALFLEQEPEWEGKEGEAEEETAEADEEQEEKAEGSKSEKVSGAAEEGGKKTPLKARKDAKPGLSPKVVGEKTAKAPLLPLAKTAGKSSAGKVVAMGKAEKKHPKVAAGRPPRTAKARPTKKVTPALTRKRKIKPLAGKGKSKSAKPVKVPMKVLKTVAARPPRRPSKAAAKRKIPAKRARRS